MKIRNGFVSNSSSSSYIITFDGMDRSDLEKLFVSGSFSGDQTSVDAVGFKEVIYQMKEWYGIGENTTYWKPENQEEEDKYKWDQFVRFSSITSRVSKAVENGNDVALVCISYNDEESHENLNSNVFSIIESFG